MSKGSNALSLAKAEITWAAPQAIVLQVSKFFFGPVGFYGALELHPKGAVACRAVREL